MVKKNKNKKITVDRNIVRERINECSSIVGLNNKTIGKIYVIIHYIFMALILFIILFNNNIYHLLICVNILFLDCLSVIILHSCPLSLLEKKYMGISERESITKTFKNMDILYKCDHEYEKQIEILTNVLIIVIIKCLLIICFRMLKINFTPT